MEHNFDMDWFDPKRHVHLLYMIVDLFTAYAGTIKKGRGGAPFSEALAEPTVEETAGSENLTLRTNENPAALIYRSAASSLFLFTPSSFLSSYSSFTMSESVFASLKLAQNNTMSLEDFRARKVALVTGK
jgi:hypothetical protein